jgi:hypothetical protein
MAKSIHWLEWSDYNSKKHMYQQCLVNFRKRQINWNNKYLALASNQSEKVTVATVIGCQIK